MMKPLVSLLSGALLLVGSTIPFAYAYEGYDPGHTYDASQYQYTQTQPTQTDSTSQPQATTTDTHTSTSTDTQTSNSTSVSPPPGGETVTSSSTQTQPSSEDRDHEDKKDRGFGRVHFNSFPVHRDFNLELRDFKHEMMAKWKEQSWGHEVKVELNHELRDLRKDFLEKMKEEGWTKEQMLEKFAAEKARIEAELVAKAGVGPQHPEDASEENHHGFQAVHREFKDEFKDFKKDFLEKMKEEGWAKDLRKDFKHELKDLKKEFVEKMKAEGWTEEQMRERFTAERARIEAEFQARAAQTPPASSPAPEPEESARPVKRDFNLLLRDFKKEMKGLIKSQGWDHEVKVELNHELRDFRHEMKAKFKEGLTQEQMLSLMAEAKVRIEAELRLKAGVAPAPAPEAAPATSPETTTPPVTSDAGSTIEPAPAGGTGATGATDAGTASTTQ